MRILARLLIASSVVFILLQFVRPGIPTPPATTEFQDPPEIKRIISQDCYSCHSNERRLLWFDQVVPAYWLVRHDILTAREHLNFSTLGAKPPAAQRAALYEAVNMAQLGAMPLPDFVALHSGARMTPEDLAALKSYLAPWSSPLPIATQLSSTPSTLVSLTAVRPEFNGIPFDPSFESWKLISTTDRGDNNTFRFILGNDIALQAARSGKITPWPDGARFAKIAWQQQQGADGFVHPGNFVQVELMIKNAEQYRSTDGWGWGRWLSVDLHPYGKDAHFVNECTGCHLPVRGDDSVYTLPISSAQLPGNEIVNDNAASLPASLPYQPLDWKVITLFVDRGSRTTSVLFGNDSALSAALARVSPTESAQPANYPAGSVLALVTWAQRDDPHWFGARIPDRPLSVEFVEIAALAQNSRYRAFTGSGLQETQPTPNTAAQRKDLILNLQPARLP
jgi:mono/diheme cytochrome c family protein